jgi:hypothetical protein
MVCYSRFHCGSYAQGLVYPARIVVHVVKRNRVAVILNLLGKSVCQPRETAHLHTHSEILALNVAGRNVLGIRLADNRYYPVPIHSTGLYRVSSLPESLPQSLINML